MQWILDEPGVLILLIIALLGFAASVRYALLKNTKENTFEKRLLRTAFITFLAVFSAGTYVYVNIDEIQYKINEKKRIENKIKREKQYKYLQENATLIGKWLNYNYNPTYTWQDYYVAIYQKEDEKYSIVYYSKKDEIIQIDYEKEKTAPYNPYIYFDDRIFNPGTLTVIQGFGTQKDTCERID